MAGSKGGLLAEVAAAAAAAAFGRRTSKVACAPAPTPAAIIGGAEGSEEEPIAASVRVCVRESSLEGVEKVGLPRDLFSRIKKKKG